MGWINYVVVPKLKAMIAVSRGLDEDLADIFVEKLNGLTEENLDVCTWDWTTRSLTDKPTQEVASVLKVYGIMSELNLRDLMLYASMKRVDEETFIISEMEEKQVEALVAKGYVRVE